MKRIVSEFIGLFIDDGALALLTVAWIAFMAAVLILVPGGRTPDWLPSSIFFLGLGAILFESVIRAASKKQLR